MADCSELIVQTVRHKAKKQQQSYFVISILLRDFLNTDINLITKDKNQVSLIMSSVLTFTSTEKGYVQLQKNPHISL